VPLVKTRVAESVAAAARDAVMIKQTADAIEEKRCTVATPRIVVPEPP
jgi:hypothetical protein